MMIRLFGAVCVAAACGYTGLSAAQSYLTQLRCCEQLELCLELMQCQMEYRHTELPELCDILTSASTGPVCQTFRELGQELRRMDKPCAAAAMALAVERCRELPEVCRGILNRLGADLGQLHLDGELRALETAREELRCAAERLNREREGKVRSYRALGLCGGAALAILLL